MKQRVCVCACVCVCVCVCVHANLIDATHSLKLCCQNEHLKVEVRVLACVEVVLTCCIRTYVYVHSIQTTPHTLHKGSPLHVATQCGGGAHRTPPKARTADLGETSGLLSSAVPSVAQWHPETLDRAEGRGISLKGRGISLKGRGISLKGTERIHH